MSEDIPFEEDQPERPSSDTDFSLDLDGYEGPIDALLQLARDQKVDLINISILALADQYLAFVQRARHLRLELAADYLVMAAWLAYLKSRLLIPEVAEDEEPSGAEMAAALKFQLQRLKAMQDAGVAIFNRPRLGQDFFARGEPTPLKVVKEPVYEAKLYDLLQAYARNKVRADVSRLRIVPMELYSVDDALARLNTLLGTRTGWLTLASFLPPDLRGGLLRRSAMAATFSASLELCRSGKLKIRQDGTFGPIFLSNAEMEAQDLS